MLGGVRMLNVITLHSNQEKEREKHSHEDTFAHSSLIRSSLISILTPTPPTILHKAHNTNVSPDCAQWPLRRSAHASALAKGCSGAPASGGGPGSSCAL